MYRHEQGLVSLEAYICRARDGFMHRQQFSHEYSVIYNLIRSIPKSWLNSCIMSVNIQKLKFAKHIENYCFSTCAELSVRHAQTLIPPDDLSIFVMAGLQKIWFNSAALSAAPALFKTTIPDYRDISLKKTNPDEGADWFQRLITQYLWIFAKERHRSCVSYLIL